MGLFENRKTQLPLWFMRQAGRYHKHYQDFKAQYSFETLCKTPELACEVTLGPVNDFNFDAAILFSDILFPLERLGMGLSFDPAPTLSKKISNIKDVDSLQPISSPEKFYLFQKKALALVKEKLSPDKTLIGFIGAPFTLYTYACEGGHMGNLLNAKAGLYNGTFEAFSKLILNELLANMSMQASSPIDTMAIFDTAAGELSLQDYKRFIIHINKKLTKSFKEIFPHIKIIYYSKHTNLDYFKRINDKNIDVLGVDWRINIADAINEFEAQYYVQGNIDPTWLTLPQEHLKNNLDIYMDHTLRKIKNPHKWIFGLGHGVLKETPEDNVKFVSNYIRNYQF